MTDCGSEQSQELGNQKVDKANPSCLPATNIILQFCNHVGKNENSCWKPCPRRVENHAILYNALHAKVNQHTVYALLVEIHAKDLQGEDEDQISHKWKNIIKIVKTNPKVGKIEYWDDEEQPKKNDVGSCLHAHKTREWPLSLLGQREQNQDDEEKSEVEHCFFLSIKTLIHHQDVCCPQQKYLENHAFEPDEIISMNHNLNEKNK